MSFVPKVKEDEDEVKLPLSWRSDPPVINENDTWWMDGEGEDEEGRLNSDPYLLERTYGGTSSCSTSRDCCPHAGYATKNFDFGLCWL